MHRCHGRLDGQWRDVLLERNTQAQAEHERYIDKVLEQQRQRLLDEEQQHLELRQDNDRDSDRQPERQPVERHPYIEQAIQDERDRQQAFEQSIDQDRDDDLGFGIE